MGVRLAGTMGTWTSASIGAGSIPLVSWAPRNSSGRMSNPCRCTMARVDGDKVTAVAVVNPSASTGAFFGVTAGVPSFEVLAGVKLEGMWARTPDLV